MRHLIIGNGPAGTGAAAEIRRRDATAAITMVSAEDDPYYTRIRLVEFLAGSLPEEKLVLRSPGWYREQEIELLLGTRVIALDLDRKESRLADGRRLAWDRLLLATGSLPLRPAVAGVEKAGVFTLRTLADARRIRSYADRVGHAIMLGGGLLGIETAAALARRGLRVTVVEFFPRLLPRQMDPAGAAILQSRLEGMGLTFVLDARAASVGGTERVEGLTLEDGRTIAGGLLVISAGVRAVTELFPDAAGLSPRGIRVDERMATSLAGISAAGDCAEHQGRNFGIWPIAEAQGKVAGANMAGGEAIYRDIVPSSTLKVAGVDLFSAGEIDADGRLESRVFAEREMGTYRKVVFRDGRLVGAILLGDLTAKREIAVAVAAGADAASLADVRARLNLS